MGTPVQETEEGLCRRGHGKLGVASALVFERRFARRLRLLFKLRLQHIAKAEIGYGLRNIFVAGIHDKMSIGCIRLLKQIPLKVIEVQPLCHRAAKLLGFFPAEHDGFRKAFHHDTDADGG